MTEPIKTFISVTIRNTPHAFSISSIFSFCQCCTVGAVSRLVPDPPLFFLHRICTIHKNDLTNTSIGKHGNPRFRGKITSLKRALWDPSGGSPHFSMDGLGTKHSSLVPTVWNYTESETRTRTTDLQIRESTLKPNWPLQRM